MNPASRFIWAVLSWTAVLGAPATFRLPAPIRFVPQLSTSPQSGPTVKAPLSVVAHPDGAPDEVWEFTDRVVLSVAGDTAIEPLLAGLPLTLDRALRPGLFVLQAPDARAAWQAAAALAAQPHVLAAYPVAHPPWTVHDAYAPAPNDDFFPAQSDLSSPSQWYLENLDSESGTRLGADINIRPAWALSRGEGVTVGVADAGVQLDHLDLAARTGGSPHFNFDTLQPTGEPLLGGAVGAHGTSCAGLAVATANNRFGMSGVAPLARVASWVIFDAKGQTVTDERLGDMYRYASNVVGVQNHSWGPDGPKQWGPAVLEDAGIEDAWSRSRDGRGVAMVRAAGNQRAGAAQADDDGYANDPRAICVAAVRRNGRASSYSEPGACLLVAAPGGDKDEGGLFTTDLSGDAGVNVFSFFPPNEYLSDYRWAFFGGFTGTSAATPLVSGVAALMLSVNPALTARDVQQILLLSGHHFDALDPGLKTNGAGLFFSHNVGFGVVDAAEAVRLARSWSNRPPTVKVTVEAEGPVAVPTAGFRVEADHVETAGVISQFPGFPAAGLQPEVATEWLPLADLGLATNDPPARLDGRAALIERGVNSFADKLDRAGAFGAAFAVVYNQAETPSDGACPGGENLCVVSGTDFSPIPMIFLPRSSGLRLKDALATNDALRVRLHLDGATRQFVVTNSLQCEHVGLRLRTSHTSRGSLRVTLRSPSGSVSVFQRDNGDPGPGPTDWTYWSTQHFYEPSAGNWELRVTEEEGVGSGDVLGATLIVVGVPITDSDGDGLDDGWELAHLATLAQGPADDPDGDGYSNLRESLEGSDPLRNQRTGSPDVGFFNDSLVRVSWPGRAGREYLLQSGAGLGSLGAPTNVVGQFPVTAAVLPKPAEDGGFFRVNLP